MKPKAVLAQLKEKERKVRRDIIIAAAEEEFAEKPFNEVSMRTIARRAGVSTAVIYQHFPDQQTLFVDTFMKGTDQIFEEIFKTINHSHNGALEKAASLYIEYFTKNDQYFRMMMNFFLSSAVDPGLFEKLTMIEKNILDHLDIIFRKMKVKGDVRIYSHTLFAAITGIVVTFRNHPSKSAEQVLKHRQKVARTLSKLFRK